MSRSTKSNGNYLSIHAASKACGLSPSVLRIWELRYQWPNPHRRPNGYRAYSKHLVDDLKRVAEMVKEGTPISEIIIDGLPEFPKEPETVDAPRRLLDFTKDIPAPRHPSAKRYRDLMINALEKRNGGSIAEIFQRASWELRPEEENLAVLLPAVCGLVEQRIDDRETPANEVAVYRTIASRCRSLERRFRVDGPQIHLNIRAAKDGDDALIAAICLSLRQQGIDAVPYNKQEATGDESISMVKIQRTTKRKRFGISIDNTCLHDILNGKATLTANDQVNEAEQAA